MKKVDALALVKAADDMAIEFSKPDREYNPHGETFETSEIIPLSERTAIIIYLKNTRKKAVAFFFLRKDSWQGFFPTDSHILGMQYLGDYKKIIEIQNWDKNFEEEES